MTQGWKEQLRGKLVEVYGEKKGAILHKKYHSAFPIDYFNDVSLEIAISDIAHLEQLSSAAPINVNFYVCAEAAEYPLCLRLFQWQKPTPLSDVLPMLENLDLRVFSERSHRITLPNADIVWVSNFTVTYQQGTVDIAATKSLFETAFVQVYLGAAENDGFNKLVLGAQLAWRDVMILRAYTKYMRQIVSRFSQPYVEKALTNHAAMARDLIAYFKLRHDPKQKHAQQQTDKVAQTIQQALEKVKSLDEDKIIRHIFALMKATLRTNYFQTTAKDLFKSYFSMKLDSRAIPGLPLPTPLYEIFVYSPRFEAIHLRYAKVARGGIRWSDRREDFRTEVLGLMKAQRVKNAVIVPSGAKGGFVLKALPPQAPRDAVLAEVVSCYQSFIRGLLDITDNIKAGKTIHPAKTVCYDDDDPYLVVAADKGTATFSDMANSISAEYNFWLGDAFASGGITGYDHKKMGITARGAWESVKRHFRELEIDITKTPITMIGIGDMSGDVFGNGLLYSKQVKLLGAFDHRHIFLDPDPNPAISYAERQRLFKLPTSSWENYNAKLISRGGGVYPRTSKSIILTAEVKKILNVDVNSLPPNELICAMLKAPVDLLWNGGIGTYVKASTESHADVSDRTNDFCRVDGGELRCKVVGEGGNLGFTQLGRVEYALKGGLINTDFIDNSAGVDCSDHEVNLKILLADSVAKGKLSQKKRNDLLSIVTQEVAELVLHDNYQQALVMSFSAYHAKVNMNLHQSYIKELETLGFLNRQIEFLPDDKKLIERKAAGHGLTRPELAVLLAYTKIHVKQEILKSSLPENVFLNQIVTSAFPASLAKKYHQAMQSHSLRRDIVATQLSNYVVNQMGITFIYRLQVETGATVEEIVSAHAVACRVFDMEKLQKTVESLEGKIPLTVQYDMLSSARRLINLATRWFLRQQRLSGDLDKIIKHYKVGVQAIEELLPTLMVGSTHEYLDKLVAQFLQKGLSKELALHIAAYRGIYTALNIIEVATKHHFDLLKTAKVYFMVGEKFNLVWFRDQIATDTREGHWNTLARLALRDELDVIQRGLTLAVMNVNGKELSVYKLIDQWMTNNPRISARWETNLSMLHASTSIEYSMFFISLGELLALIQSGSVPV